MIPWQPVAARQSVKPLSLTKRGLSRLSLRQFGRGDSRENPLQKTNIKTTNTMKVKELIQILSQFNGKAELDIHTDNYEMMDIEVREFNDHVAMVVFPAIKEPDNE